MTGAAKRFQAGNPSAEREAFFEGENPSGVFCGLPFTVSAVTELDKALAAPLSAACFARRKPRITGFPAAVIRREGRKPGAGFRAFPEEEPSAAG